MFGHKKSDANLANNDNITLIGESSTVEGNIVAKAYVKVDGKIIGNLNIEGSIILGENGCIKGNISSGEVIVYGRIEGDIHADNLQLKASAVITGDIEAKTLQIDPGAVYQGSVTMQAHSVPQLLASA
jgi:cytoskeletal protein CcmA (bactofilin family)